jgi:hypothetical protein
MKIAFQDELQTWVYVIVWCCAARWWDGTTYPSHEDLMVAAIPNESHREKFDGLLHYNLDHDWKWGVSNELRRFHLCTGLCFSVRQRRAHLQDFVITNPETWQTQIKRETIGSLLHDYVRYPFDRSHPRVPTCYVYVTFVLPAYRKLQQEQEQEQYGGICWKHSVIIYLIFLRFFFQQHGYVQDTIAIY